MQKSKRKKLINRWCSQIIKGIKDTPATKRVSLEYEPGKTGHSGNTYQYCSVSAYKKTPLSKYNSMTIFC